MKPTIYKVAGILSNWSNKRKIDANTATLLQWHVRRLIMGIIRIDYSLQPIYFVDASIALSWRWRCRTGRCRIYEK